MTPLDGAALYRGSCRIAAYLTDLCPVPDRPCRACNHQWLLVEATSVESDMIAALWWAGRRPLLASRREVAW